MPFPDLRTEVYVWDGGTVGIAIYRKHERFDVRS